MLFRSSVCLLLERGECGARPRPDGEVRALRDHAKVLPRAAVQLVDAGEGRAEPLVRRVVEIEHRGLRRRNLDVLPRLVGRAVPASYELRVTSYKLQVTIYKLQVKLPVTSYQSL